jgi:hypothetical protein
MLGYDTRLLNAGEKAESRKQKAEMFVGSRALLAQLRQPISAFCFLLSAL